MQTQPTRFTLLPEGFHCDKHLQKVAQILLSEANFFIETGTNVGSTLHYVARSHPEVSCYSCEPDAKAYTQAQANTCTQSNVKIFQEDALTFLQRLTDLHPDCRKQRTVFWLDAHCFGHGWPLPAEVKFIAAQFEQPWILIDDCEVPGRPDFAFHAFPGENCTINTVLHALPTHEPYRLWHPSYQEHTSPCHPLTGWCLLALGKTLESAEHLLAKVPAGLISENPY